MPSVRHERTSIQKRWLLASLSGGVRGVKYLAAGLNRRLDFGAQIRQNPVL